MLLLLRCCRWPRPALTVDTVIVAQPQQASSTPAQLLLIQRKHAPCQGQWALPGGFVDEKEPLHAAAARELQEETSVSPDRVKLTQVSGVVLQGVYVLSLPACHHLQPPLLLLLCCVPCTCAQVGAYGG
jgi:ADP-ribose pyrophosphatase YjhB (NUDIX family)